MAGGYKEIDLGGAKKSEEQVLGSLFTNYNRRMEALNAKTNLPDTDPRRIAPENLRAERSAAEKEFRVYADTMVKKDLGLDAWKTLSKGDGLLAKMKTMESEAAKEIEEKIATFKIKNKTPQVAEFQAEIEARFKSSGRVSAIESALEHCGKQIEEKGWTMSRVESYLIGSKIVSPDEYKKIMEIAKKCGIVTDEALKDVLVFIAPTVETEKLPWKQRYPKNILKALSFNIYDVGDAAGAVKAGVENIREDPVKAARAAQRKLFALGGGGVVLIAGAIIAYKIFSSDEKPPASNTTTSTVPVIKDAFKNNVAEELKVPKGRNMDLLFEGKMAEDYSVNITAEVRKLAPNPEEQKRIFLLVQKMYTLNPAFKEQIINNTLPLGNVPVFVSALYELQKCGLPPESIATISANIAVRYDTGSYVQMSKDISAYLYKNPKLVRNIEVVSSNPAEFNAAFGKTLKHEYKPSASWNTRPFQAFLAGEPKFSEKEIKGNVSQLSEQIRMTFPPQDQEEIASKLAAIYQGATSGGGPAQVNKQYADHVKFLKQIRDKGFSVEDSFKILMLIEKNVTAVPSESGPWSNIGKYSKPIVLGRLLEGINKNSPFDEIEARARAILNDSPKNWTMRLAPLFNQLEVTPLTSFLDGTKLNNRQKDVVILAVKGGRLPDGTEFKGFFNPAFQAWLLEGVVPKQGAPEGIQLAQVAARLTPSMSDTQIIEQIHALGFERGLNWTTPAWDTYLDPELSQTFQETDSQNKKAEVAKLQHEALNNAQYVEERKLLMAYIDWYQGEKNTRVLPGKDMLAAAKKAAGIMRNNETKVLPYEDRLKLMIPSEESEKPRKGKRRQS